MQDSDMPGLAIVAMVLGPRRTNAGPVVTLVTYRDGPLGWCSRVMFLPAQCLCPVGFGAARARMADLVADGWLGGASAAAYQDGISHLLWAVPPDGTPAAPPRLAHAHFLNPVHRDNASIMGMRWQALSVTGQLFPALDADVTLTAEGSQHTLVTLTGVYRSPLSPLSRRLDRTLVHQVANATVTSLLPA